MGRQFLGSPLAARNLDAQLNEALLCDFFL